MLPATFDFFAPDAFKPEATLLSRLSAALDVSAAGAMVDTLAVRAVVEAVTPNSSNPVPELTTNKVPNIMLPSAPSAPARSQKVSSSIELTGRYTQYTEKSKVDYRVSKPNTSPFFGAVTTR